MVLTHTFEQKSISRPVDCRFEVIKLLNGLLGWMIYINYPSSNQTKKYWWLIILCKILFFFHFFCINIYISPHIYQTAWSYTNQLSVLRSSRITLDLFISLWEFTLIHDIWADWDYARLMKPQRMVALNNVTELRSQPDVGLSHKLAQRHQK